RNGFQLGVEPAIEKNQKPKACRLQHFALGSPAVALFAGGRIQPETRIRKCLTQGLQVAVSGVVVAVKTEIVEGGSIGLLSPAGVQPKNCDCGHRQHDPEKSSHWLMLLGSTPEIDVRF